MSDRIFWRSLILIALLAAVLRVGHLASVQDTPFYSFHETWNSSDMYSNRTWAEHVAGGNWLDREAFRPWFDWQGRIATPETWRRWLGRSTYYQPPLYTYILALALKFGVALNEFRWLQALLGAANVLLLGLLGRRLFSPLAGLVAALLAAGYAPFILYDGEILRGTVVLALNLLALLALLAAERGTGRVSGRAAWLIAGAALGAAFLGDSAILTFIPLAGLFALLAGLYPAREEEGAGPGGGGGWGAGLARVGLLAGGFLAALLPLFIRNAAVGAPLLSSTTRAPLVFIMGNAPDAVPVGAAIPPSTGEILAASDYRLGSTILETLRAHDGPGRLISMQWEKLSGLLNSYEVPDNPSFYYAALESPVLAWGLRFSCISGLGLAGLLLAARRLRRHRLLHLYLLGTISLFLLAQVVSRYRQVLVVPLLLAAGFAVAEAWRAVRERRLPAAAGILAGSILISVVLPSTPPPGYRYYRSAEFLVAARQLAERGEVAAAGREIRRAVELADREFIGNEDRVSLNLALGELYYGHEHYPEALSAYRDVLVDDPRNAEALAVTGAIHHDLDQPMRALKVLLMAEMADPENPEVHARLGHLFWFVFHDGEKALPHLRKAVDLAPSSPVSENLRNLAEGISAATGVSP